MKMHFFLNISKKLAEFKTWIIGLCHTWCGICSVDGSTGAGAGVGIEEGGVGGVSLAGSGAGGGEGAEGGAAGSAFTSLFSPVISPENIQLWKKIMF